MRWLLRALSPSDRVWGDALLRELGELPPRARPRWALGLLTLILARAPGVRTGAAAGAVIAADLAYSNLGPGSAHPASEPVAPVLLAYLLLAGLFVATGFVQRGRGQAVADCARAGAITATVIVVLAFAATLVIDNVWLGVVARQPDKIYGLAHSGLFHTMRAYLIGQNLLGLVIVTPIGAGFAAALGGLGARLRGSPAHASAPSG